MNGRLHTVSIGKPSELMSNFLDGLVFKNRISVFRTSLAATSLRDSAVITLMKNTAAVVDFGLLAAYLAYSVMLLLRDIAISSFPV